MRSSSRLASQLAGVFLLSAWADWVVFFWIQVLRWSALAFGVAYGVTHQRSITVAQRAQHEKHQYDEQQKKIDRAKAEYAKQKAPPAAASSGGMRIPFDRDLA
jgi:hypothetical protein